jgi:hypothetical protein
MKTSIPSEVWEKKKSLIAKLYKDEEWPLKQVIKQIRTEDFNPSETQLRSRLKKWRVTKPSRQARKKPSSPQEMEDDDQPGDTSPVNPKPKVLPAPAALHSQQPQLQPQPKSRPPLSHPKPHLKPLQTSISEWYDASGPYQRLQSTPQQPVQLAALPFDRQELDSWGSPLEAQQVSSEPQDESSQLPNCTPAMSHFPSPSIPSLSISTSSPYELHSVITHSNGVTMSTAPLMTPTYSAVYDGSPETCLPSPTSPTWPTGTEPDASRTVLPIATWFSSPYEGSNPLSTAPFYPAKTTGSPMAGYGQMIQPILAPDLSPVFSQSPPDTFTAALWDDGPILKPYRRAIASGYHSHAASGHVRVDRQGRQRKPLTHKKRKETLLGTSSAAMVPLSQSHSQF